MSNNLLFSYVTLYTIFMITPELISYIKNQLTLGLTEIQIGKTLKAHGWMEADIHEALATIYPAPTVVPTPAAPVVEPVQVTPVIAEPIAHVAPVQPAQYFEPIQPAQPVQPTQPIQPVATPLQTTIVSPMVTPMVQTMPVMQTTPVQPVQPAYQPQVQQNFYAQQPPVMKSRKWKKAALIVGIVVFIVVIAGGAYAYVSGYFTPLDKITAQAFESIYSANSGSFDITTNIDMSALTKGTNALPSLLPAGILSDKSSFTTKGQYDISDPKNKKFVSTISFDLGSTSATIDLRAVNGTLYAGLTKAPTIAMFPVLTSLENQYVAFPYGANTDTSVPAMIPGLDPKILTSLTSDQKAGFYKITKNAHFIKITQKLGTETINNDRSYHFTFDLDRAGITQYLSDIKDYIHTIGKDDSKLSSFDPTSYAKDLDSIKDFKGEAWISKKDKLLNKVDISFTVVGDPKTETDGVKINIIGIFSDWNQPVTVNPPANSMKFEDFLAKALAGFADSKGNLSISGGLSGDSSINTRAQDAKLQSIVTEERAAAELYYQDKNSFKGFCKSSQFVKDPGVICKDFVDGYSAYTKLSTGSYFCSDAKGAALVIKTKPNTVTCRTIVPVVQ